MGPSQCTFTRGVDETEVGLQKRVRFYSYMMMSNQFDSYTRLIPFLDVHIHGIYHKNEATCDDHLHNPTKRSSRLAHGEAKIVIGAASKNTTKH